MLGFAKTLFGSSNDRKVKQLSARVAKINGLEAGYAALSEEQLRAKTGEFKARLAAALKQSTSVPNAWLVQPLGMGQPASASQVVRRWQLREEGRVATTALLAKGKT